MGARQCRTNSTQSECVCVSHRVGGREAQPGVSVGWRGVVGPRLASCLRACRQQREPLCVLCCGSVSTFTRPASSSQIPCHLCRHQATSSAAVHCVWLTQHRVKWEQTDTITENYQVNKFVLDPNEGFGRNKRSKPLKSREEREEEDGQTFSDDDGEYDMHTTVAAVCVPS